MDFDKFQKTLVKILLQTPNVFVDFEKLLQENEKIGKFCPQDFKKAELHPKLDL